MMKKSLLIFLFLSLIAGNAFSTSTVVLSEIYYDTFGSYYNEEWIEIFNPSSANIDIGGYSIADNSRIYTIASGTILNPGQVLIFAKDLEGFLDLGYGIMPDFTNLNLNLNNDGDVLILRDAGNLQIDMVAWENEIPGWSLVADKGESLQRQSLLFDETGWAEHCVPNPGSASVVIPEPSSLLLVALGFSLITCCVAMNRNQKSS